LLFNFNLTAIKYSFAQADEILPKINVSWVGGRLAPFYIHQMNRVNFRNGSAMMTAPYYYWILLLLLM